MKKKQIFFKTLTSKIFVSIAIYFVTFSVLYDSFLESTAPLANHSPNTSSTTNLGSTTNSASSSLGGESKKDKQPFSAQTLTGDTVVRHDLDPGLENAISNVKEDVERTEAPPFKDQGTRDDTPMALESARDATGGAPHDSRTVIQAVPAVPKPLPKGEPTSTVSAQNQEPSHQITKMQHLDHQPKPHSPPRKSKFPIFNSTPSPGSMCHPNSSSESNESVASYCKIASCMQHQKDVDDELLHSSQVDSDEDSNTKGCKMLWFAAMHESERLCDTASGQHAYNVDYSVALNSALENANDSLQPVLILGRYGMPNENSTEPRKLGRWAEERGVKVVYSPRISFQEDVNKGMPSYVQKNLFSRLQGPFLRLDIPQFIKEHDLLDMPNVCKDHVLYTDVDVMFANRITQRDVQMLSNLVGQDSVLSYGRESSKGPALFNTGVMVINAKRFEEELPQILKTARDAQQYPSHDQKMLNLYRETKNTTKEKFRLLPMHYNWKAYWGLEPSDFSDVKILHFHGPKLGRGLEELSTCNVTAISNFPKPYQRILTHGICCDKGRTAEWSIAAIANLRAPMNDLCDSDVSTSVESDKRP